MTKTDDDNANEQYNEKVLNQSSWISAEFLEEVLSASLGEDVKVLDHSVKAAVGVGDNYMSLMYRTTVKYSGSSQVPQTKHLMIKGAPTAKFLQEMIEEMGIFVKEVAMYNRTLPSMQGYLKKFFPPDAVHVAPESYKCTRDNTLVMEDLAESGYKMGNRRSQLDFEHALITLRTLARFHALSVQLYRDDPELVVSVTKDFYDESSRDKMESFLDMTFPVLTTAIKSSWQDSSFGDSLTEIGKFLFDKVLHMMKAKYKLTVMNHGDMWVNNILYKYEEDGSVIGAKLVDYQLSRYTSPAADLHYFFFSSVQPDVLSSRMDDLVTAYHKHLIADLATLGISVDFTKEDLEEDLVNMATFGVLTMAQLLPIIVAPPSEVLDMDKLDLEEMKKVENQPEEHPMMKNYKNKNFEEIAGKYIKLFEKIGYLDAARDRMKDVVKEAEIKKAKREAEKAAAADEVKVQ